MTNQNTLDRINAFELSVFSKLMRYDAFGKVRWQSQTDTRNKNTFVGGHGIVDDSDDDGLTFMRARYYDAEIGRFISRDPIGAGSNYVYCNNNAINRTDTTGLCEDNILDDIQTVLDYAGLIPGIGDLIDGGNALIYLLRGDYLNASLTGAAAIPFLGTGATVVKATGKAATKLEKAAKLGKAAEELISGSLKRSPSYASEYASKSYGEIEKLAKGGDQKAKQMKKLIEQGPRLRQK